MRNESNGLKQQAPACKEQPVFGWITGVGTCLCISRALVCVCSWARGGAWGPSGGQEASLHILNGTKKTIRGALTHVWLCLVPAPTITLESPPSFHKHFMYVFKWEYSCVWEESASMQFNQPNWSLLTRYSWDGEQEE